MEQNIISLAFDMPLFEGQIKSITDQLNGLMSNIQGISTSKIPLQSGGGVTELVSSVKAYETATNNAAIATAALEKEETKLIKIHNDLVTAKAKSIKAENDLVTAKVKSEAISKKTAKQLDDESNEYKKLALAVKDAERKYYDLAITQGRNSAAAKEALKDVIDLKAKQVQLNEDVGNYTHRVGNYSGALTSYANGLRGLRGPTKLLGEALGVGAMQADQFRLIIEHSLQGIAALFRSKERKAAAEAADTVATAANTSANVANAEGVAADAVATEGYTAATVAATGATSLFSTVLKFSGIGLLIGVIGGIIYSIVSYVKEMNALKKVQEEYNDILQDTSSDVQKTIKEVSELKESFKLYHAGLKTGKDVLDEYNNTLGKTMGATNDVTVAEKRLVAFGPDYIEMNKQKAIANAAYAAVAKLTFDQEMNDMKEEQLGWWDRLNAYRTHMTAMQKIRQGVSLITGVPDADVILAEQTSLDLKITENKKQQNIELQKQIDNANSIADKAATTAAGISKKHNWKDPDDKSDKEKKEKIIHERQLAELKEYKNTSFEIEVLDRERNIKFQEDIWKDDKQNFDRRLEALQEFTIQKSLLLKRQEANEIALKESEAARETFNEEEKKKGKSKAEVARIDENITIIEKNKQEAIKLIREQYLIKEIDDEKLAATNKAKVVAENDKKIHDAKMASIKNYNDEIVSLHDAQYKAELANLNISLKQKLISQEEYEKKKKEIEKNNAIQVLEDRKADLTAHKYAVQQAGGNTNVLSNEIAGTQSQIDALKNSPDDEDKKGHKLTKKQKAEIDIVQSTQKTIQGLVDARYEKEIQAIQRVIDANNKRKESEVQAINSSTLSAQEKAAQLIILDKTVAANNEKLARDQRDIKIKQAKFDRDAAVVSILEKAAIAEYEVIGTGQPWLAVAIAAASEAEIAMILSKPLPTYGEGTDFHQGGGAIVGEKKISGNYQPELVQPNGGNSFIVNKPTFLSNLPRGSKVVPLTQDVINQAMYSGMMANIFSMNMPLQTDNGLKELKDAIFETGYMTAQAIKKQKGANVTVNVNGSWGAYIDKNVRN